MRQLLEYMLEQDDVFRPATPEEIKTRKARYKDIRRKEWMDEFLKRDDVHKNEDGSYDVDGDVDIRDMDLTELPLRFGKVGGYFDCSYNRLISLEHAPRTVRGDFSCYNNRLTSLEHAPRTVGRVFNCSYNRLTSLEGAPRTVGGDFWCADNSKKFTEDDVRKVSKVKGGVYV